MVLHQQHPGFQLVSEEVDPSTFERTLVFMGPGKRMIKRRVAAVDWNHVLLSSTALVDRDKSREPTVAYVFDDTLWADTGDELDRMVTAEEVAAATKRAKQLHLG